MRIINLKKITAFALATVQCVCLSQLAVVNAEEANSNITSVITWEQVKERDENGKFTTITPNTAAKGTVTYNEAEDCIDIAAAKDDQASFMLKNMEINGGYVTVSSKIKVDERWSGLHFGKLGFNGAESFQDGTSYGYRDNGCINWDYKGGNDWAASVKIDDYPGEWLGFEYQIDFSGHKITGKISRADGSTLHSYNRPFRDNDTYLSALNFGMSEWSKSSIKMSVKDLNIIKEGISVTGASIEDGAENIKPENIEIKFSNTVSLEKVKEALKVYDEEGNKTTCKVILAEDSKSVFVTVTEAEEGFGYTIEIESGKELGAYGSLTEPYGLSFTAMEIPMSDGTLMTWAEAKNPDIWKVSNVKDVSFGYNAEEDCLVAERTNKEVSCANICLSGLESSPKSGVLDIEFKLKFEADDDISGRYVEWGMMQLTDAADKIGYKMTDTLNWMYYGSSNSDTISSSWSSEHYASKFTDWVTITYHIDFMANTFSGKILFSDESMLSFNRYVRAGGGYLRYFGFNVDEGRNLTGKLSIKDLSIKRTSLEGKISKKDNMSGNSDVVVKFNAPIKKSDLKAAIKVQDENSVEINSSAIATEVEDGTKGIISVFGLIPNKTYKLIIQKSLTRADGVAGLSDDMVYEFTPKSTDTTLSFENAAVALADIPSQINSQKAIGIKTTSNAEAMLNSIKLFDKDGNELAAPIEITKLSNGEYTIAPQGGLDYDSEYVFKMQSGTETISIPIKTKTLENSGVYATSSVSVSGTTAAATIKVQNATDEAAQALVMIAAYDSANKLIGIASVKTEEIAKGKSSAKTINVTAAENIERTEVVVLDLSSNKSIYIKK